MKLFWWIGGFVGYLLIRESGGSVITQLLVLLICGWLGREAAQNEDKIVQKRRNDTANEVAQELFNEFEKINKKMTPIGFLLNEPKTVRPLHLNPKAFKGALFLYLRPFISDGRVFVDNPRKNSMLNLLITSSIPPHVNLEELILRSVEDHGLLVAIGKDTGFVGAGRVITWDDDWKKHFSNLAITASRIFSVPSSNDSTLWELQWLAERGLFDKVVMIFTDLHFKPSESTFYIDTLRPKLIAMGWQLPDNLGAGSLVAFEPNGSLSIHIEKSKFKVHLIKEFALYGVPGEWCL